MRSLFDLRGPQIGQLFWIRNFIFVVCFLVIGSCNEKNMIASCQVEENVFTLYKEGLKFLYFKLIAMSILNLLMTNTPSLYPITYLVSSCLNNYVNWIKQFLKLRITELLRLKRCSSFFVIFQFCNCSDKSQNNYDSK